MKPDTSRWREHDRYNYFNALPIEGLAWECLRRDKSYQQQYRELVTAKAETAPLPLRDQLRWGLRFPGEPGPVGRGSRRPLVRFGCPVNSRRRRFRNSASFEIARRNVTAFASTATRPRACSRRRSRGSTTSSSARRVWEAQLTNARARESATEALRGSRHARL